MEKPCPEKCTTPKRARKMCARCVNKTCEIQKCTRKNGKKGRKCAAPGVTPTPSTPMPTISITPMPSEDPMGIVSPSPDMFM